MSAVTELPQVDVVGVGLNATDTLIPLPAYPERGSKLEYSDGQRDARRPGGDDRGGLPDLGPSHPLRGQAGRRRRGAAARADIRARGRGCAAHQGSRRREPAVAHPGGRRRRAHRALPARRAHDASARGAAPRVDRECARAARGRARHRRGHAGRKLGARRGHSRRRRSRRHLSRRRRTHRQHRLPDREPAIFPAG